MVQTGSFRLAPSHLSELSFEPVDATVRRCRLHCTKGSSLDVWEYGPGEFDYQADVDQSACILSGEAEVDLADGRFLSLQAGMAFFMPRGLHGHWIIRETLRTVAVRGS